jgi:hypothetical protein
MDVTACEAQWACYRNAYALEVLLYMYIDLLSHVKSKAVLYVSWKCYEYLQERFM